MFKVSSGDKRVEMSQVFNSVALQLSDSCLSEHRPCLLSLATYICVLVCLPEGLFSKQNAQRRP